MSKQGLFITFEGGEGSGKTTQIHALERFLSQSGYEVVKTREPGGTPEAEKIRDFLVSREGGDWSPEAEVLLLYAARSMHVQQIILPALQRGACVISDRFSDSTLAYQGYGHGYDLDKIKQLDHLILNGFQPDLTFILDIPAEQGLQRSKARLSAETTAKDQQEDRFENLALEFHDKLRNGFLDIAKQNPERCHVIDARQDIHAVTDYITAIMRGVYNHDHVRRRS